MKTIKLNLPELVRSGQLTPEEASRLTSLAQPDKAMPAIISTLLIFGALAIAGAAIALVPNATTGLVLAATALASAELLRRLTTADALKILASALAIMGTIGLGGWLAFEMDDQPVQLIAIAVTTILAIGAIWFRSTFLGAVSVLSLGAALGSGTSYWHACYGLYVEEPTLTIALFGVITGGLYALRSSLSDIWESMTTVAARAAFFMVNFAFWVGSLWEDHVGDSFQHFADYSARQAFKESAFVVPESVFTIGWVLVLGAIIVKARQGGFLAVTSLVFLGIHAYTQYFEFFGAKPMALLIAGITLVGLAVAGAHWISNMRKAAEASPV